MLNRAMDWSYERIKLSVIANLLRLAVDVFGVPEDKDKLISLEGEEFELEFPALNGSIIIQPQGNRVLTQVGAAEDPAAKIIINVKDEKIIDVLEDVTKSSPRWGIIKLFFKYILWRRIKIKGSLRKAAKTFKGMRFGGNEEFEKSDK